MSPSNENLTVVPRRQKILLVVAAFVLSGCIWSPANRTDQESDAGIVMSGYSSTKGEVVTFTAKDQNTGSVGPIGTATASTTASFSSPDPFYPWSKTLTPAANYWAPQSVTIDGVPLQPNGLATSIGRVEITAAGPDNTPYVTFSPEAESCVGTLIGEGESVGEAGESCSDGASLVVFDTDGVGNNAETGGWTADYTAAGPGATTWQVGHYPVQGKTIYGLLCYPTASGSYPAMIINHDLTPTFDLDNGALGVCQSFAELGYVTAMSAYRGESVAVTGPPQSYTSGGVIELCLGEVIDSIRLTNIVRGWTSACGGSGEPPCVDDTRVVMWGHSHGACITARAVEAGVQVNAAAWFAAPTDFYAWYEYCLPGSACYGKTPLNDGSMATTLGIVGEPITPDMSRIPYDWRSPVTYAADLTAAAKAGVKTLVLQGGSDLLIQPSQACELTAAFAGPSAATPSLNWHFDSGNGVDTMPPTGCPTGQLHWQSVQNLPTDWPNSSYLLVYDADDHGSILFGPAWDAFLSWLPYAI